MAFNNSNTFLCIVFASLLATHLFGVYLFATGFFPQKESFPGFSTLDDFPETEGPEGVKVPAKYDRLVFLVIDAFRSDFVFNQQSEMKFVKSLIESGKARGYISKAHAPTVTLPRIKALISGSIPSFSDFIMNFHSTELKEDNLIDQFILAGKNVSFYGDDTWLKLFPKRFTRFEGVSSFYVTDYTEVDNNVTRHIEAELEKDDWSLLVLHYLGLDHIGHMEGPQSSLMGPKIKEMDSIVEYIYNLLKQQDLEYGSRSLLVVCSDHGMNEVGNHGGTSEGETSAVMIFLSHALEPHLNLPEITTVAQVDLTPTLAVLMGLPIPKNSVGTLILDLITDYPVEQYLRALEYNCLQRLQLMKANSLFWSKGGPTKSSAKIMRLFEEAQQMHASWAATPLKHSHFESQAAALYIEFMHQLYSEFARALTTYDDYELVLGTTMIAASTLGFLVFVWGFVRQFMTRANRIITAPFFWLLFAFFVSASIITHFQLVCPFVDSQLCHQKNVWLAYTLCVLLGASISLVLCATLFGFSQRIVFVKGGGSMLVHFIIFGFILHLVSLFASSLVEEEHQTWYFLVTTGLILSLVSSFYNPNNSSWQKILLTLVCFRLLRCWNQTGVKWMDNLRNIDETTIDFGKWLDAPYILNRLVRVCICGIACILPCIYAGRFADDEKKLIGKVTSAVFRNSINFCGISIFVYKFSLFPFPSIWMARFVYLCFGVAMFVVIGYPFWKGQKRVPDRAIEHQPTLDDLIMTYSKTTPVLMLFSFTMLLLLLSKVHNMFVFVLMGVAAHYLNSYATMSTHYYTRVFEVMAITHWMGQAAFFGLGNSNALSTIDLSGAYTGVSGYSDTTVGTLVAIIMYSGPSFFYLSSIVVITRMYYTEHSSKGTHSYSKMAETYIFICLCLALFRSLQIFIFSIVTIIMKHHLFVWSIYEIMADGYMLISVIFCFILFLHTCLIGLKLDRRKRKNKRNKNT